MWDGPGHGPRGGPPFRGDHRGEMFRGRNHPMQDYRGRGSMHMGHMGPRHHGGPSMDMRRMDGPPMRGYDMDPRDMQGREPNQDFFGPRGDPDFRRHCEFPRDRPMYPSGFGRDPGDMGGRGMHPSEPSRFMDMREREPFYRDMPRFNSPHSDAGRGFPMDLPEEHDGFSYRRLPMGNDDSGRFEMNLPPHERRMMDSERREGPPFNSRGRFDSDIDFRNRPGPPAEFGGRDRSPLMLKENDVPTLDRERPDMPLDVPGPLPSHFVGTGDGNSDYQESGNSPLMDYRSGEEMTLAEEWKNRQKDKNPFMSKDMGNLPETHFPAGFGRNINVCDPPPFHEREKSRGNFADHGGPFSHLDLPPLGNKSSQDHLLPELNPPTSQMLRDNKPNRMENPAYQPEKKERSLEIQEPKDRFERTQDLPHREGASTDEVGKEHNRMIQGKDQDYRDKDYRTGSGRLFEYKHDELQRPETLLKDPKQDVPSKFTDSGSQDQDYRSATIKEKVSNVISISGIPKTATMEQIIGAFAVREDVPMQGMKIRNVVPGYSYDMAYVEFLNLEDAVHFMESNKGSLKVGSRTTSMKYVEPEECERAAHNPDHKVPLTQDSNRLGSKDLSKDLKTDLNESDQMQRMSDLTPEAWQQQVDQRLQQFESEQQGELWNNRNPHHSTSSHSSSVFQDSKTMIIKNVKSTTTIETILKALDPFAYLDERNVRLVKGKPPVTKCFCFVDMDSHEQVTRLVELLTKPKHLCIDGVRVYAEVAKPLKNQKREFNKSNASLLGQPPDVVMMAGPSYPHAPPPFLHSMPPPVAPVPTMQGEMMCGSSNPHMPPDPSLNQQGMNYAEPPAEVPLYQTSGLHVPTDPAGITTAIDAPHTYICGSETPDVSNYLYDSTSGFYYDPETTLYYDPNSRYFYNAQTQEYLYWDGASKTYIPVPGGQSASAQPLTMTAEDQAILSNPAADAPLEMKKPPSSPQPAAAPPSAPASSVDVPPTSTTGLDKKEEDDSTKKEKEEKPKSLAAVKIMKDMERWAKIQNRQKDVVRAPSPVLKSGLDDDRRQSKSADAAFAIFERKGSGGEDLFKKPLTPLKKDEKSKRPMGSLGLLASDYAAGSDEEVEEDKEEAARSSQSSQSEEKEDKLTDWRKMACLLCRRQFPNKDALIRHQQLSDLHKQNMEIHLKIKRSKKELEALENQEKELNAREVATPPEPKRRKHHHQQQQHRNTWAGSSREMSKGSERPGLGSEPVQKQRPKKEPVVWDHGTYKQAVRKAMFARFKELE